MIRGVPGVISGFSSSEEENMIENSGLISGNF